MHHLADHSSVMVDNWCRMMYHLVNMMNNFVNNNSGFMMIDRFMDHNRFVVDNHILGFLTFDVAEVAVVTGISDGLQRLSDVGVLEERLDVMFGLAAAVLIAPEIEFEASQMGAVLEALKKMEDSVISHMFAVPEPKLEILKNTMVNDLSKLVKPRIGDLVAPTEIDVHLAEINEPVQRVTE